MYGMPQRTGNCIVCKHVLVEFLFIYRFLKCLSPLLNKIFCPALNIFPEISELSVVFVCFLFP